MSLKKAVLAVFGFTLGFSKEDSVGQTNTRFKTNILDKLHKVL